MLGVTFGNKHSYNDWGIWLEDTHINPPLPKRYIVDVPARNGLLDLTPELTPTIRFENRTLTFTFRVKAGDWSTLLSEIYGQIHGQTLDVVSDLDPNWHWHGCVTVDDFSSDERTGVLVITVDADPFKLSNTENSYTVNGNGTITCVVDRMEISPAFEIDAQTTVIYGDSSYTITSTQTTEKTASGDIVSFGDGTDNPVEELKASVDAVQSGSGDPSPSNVRPIAGWNEVNVNVSGVNIWDEEWELGTLNTSTGAETSSSTNIRAKNYISVKPSTTYFITAPQNVRLIWFDSSKTYIEYVGSGTGLQTSPSNAAFARFYMVTAYGTTYNNDISINYPSTDTAYHEHIGNTYTTSLGSTYYGGTLNVTTGELVVDKKMLDGNLFTNVENNLSGDGSSAYVSVAYTDFKAPYYYMKTNCLTRSNENWNKLPAMNINVTSPSYIVVCSNVPNQTLAQFKTWFNENVQLLLELATPQTYQLSPMQVRTLLGVNNIWADSGSVQVNYIAQDFAGRKFYIPDLELTEGSHSLTIQGTGTTTVTYTNGRL